MLLLIDERHTSDNPQNLKGQLAWHIQQFLRGEGKNQHPSCPQALKACTPVFTDTCTPMHKRHVHIQRDNQRDRDLLLGKDRYDYTLQSPLSDPQNRLLPLGTAHLSVLWSDLFLCVSEPNQERIPSAATLRDKDNSHTTNTTAALWMGFTVRCFPHRVGFLLRETGPEQVCAL